MLTDTLGGTPANTRWRAPLIGWLAVLAVMVAVMWEPLAGMVAIWERSQTFAHAYVVAPIAAWLVWRMRAEVAVLVPAPTPSVAAWLVLPALLWHVGTLTQVNALQHFMVVTILVLSVPAMFGWQVARALMFPLGFLYFMVPFGEFLTPMLVDMTADFAAAAIRLSGVPIYREANQFVIPSGRWSVVDACSGIRYLMASLMVGTLFAYLNYSSLKRRWMFVGVAIVVPIVANWLRAYMIVMIGHLSNNQLATGVDHIVYGWVFFGIVVLLMFMIGARWADAPLPGGVARVAEGTPGQPADGPSATRVLTVAASVMAGIVVFGALPDVWLSRGSAAEDQAAASCRPLPPTLSAGWGRVDTAPPISLKPEGASQIEQAAYTQGGATVWVSVADFSGSKAGRLVSSVHKIGYAVWPHWNPVEDDIRSLAAGDAPLEVRRTVLVSTAEQGFQPRKVHDLRLYWIDGGHPTTSDAGAKLQQLSQRIRGSSGQGKIIDIMVLDSEARPADAVLQRFAAEAYPPFARWLATCSYGGAGR
ncbi:exosortase A [Aquabacterium sp.]|uniref:exosortase A n=1 Tax=Aquabacterium sp. TaxID=1872578 RepID=UPI003783D0F5